MHFPDMERMAKSDARELIEAVANGDAGAEAALFEAEAERIWRILFRLTGSPDDADDLTRETFLRAFESASTFRSRGSARGWLARIALNLTRDGFKRRRRREALLAQHSDPEGVSPRLSTSVDRRVRAAVECLPEDQRIVVLMHDLEGYTHSEIAQAIGIAPGSSRSRLSRARAVLREQLQDLVEEATR